MIEVKNNPTANLYEAFLDGKSAGVCHYRIDGQTITFTHTVVDPEFEGKGVGSAIAKHVLDDSRAHGFKVVPTCKFIATYISRHSEYQDLVSA